MYVILYIIEKEGEIVIVQERLNWLHGGYYIVCFHCFVVVFFSLVKNYD